MGRYLPVRRSTAIIALVFAVTLVTYFLVRPDPPALRKSPDRPSTPANRPTGTPRPTTGSPPATARPSPSTSAGATPTSPAPSSPTHSASHSPVPSSPTAESTPGQG
jgi:hypothetical protein